MTEYDITLINRKPLPDKYYVQELEEFRKDFESATFQPFPSVQETIEAITETAGNIIDGDTYLNDVFHALNDEIERHYNEWLEVKR